MTDSERHVYDDIDRSEMDDLLPAGVSRLLDVGCSWGAFGKHLRMAFPGIEVIGIDPSAPALAVASERLNGAIKGAFPDALPSDIGQFDCITFNDALEHIADPWAALEACKPLLRPGARVVAAIPNVRWVKTSLGLLMRGDWRYEDSGILDRTHLRFFTRSGIQAIFADTGYEIVSLYPWTAAPRVIRLQRLLGHQFDDLLCQHFHVAARALPGPGEART